MRQVQELHNFNQQWYTVRPTHSCMAVASRRSETVSQHCTQRSLTKRDVRETVIEFARHLRVAGVRIARCRRRTALS